jgi:hypothetical protein
MTSTQASGSSSIDELAAKVGRRWPAIDTCAADSKTERDRIITALESEKLIPPDCSFIVSGSLARNEFTPGPQGVGKLDKKTEGSDVDWTLLVDGAADPQHLPAVQKIAKVLQELGFKPPGPAAVFGGLAFSHELVHLIGGDNDTNRNLTRRILLLLESRALGDDNGVRDRVMRAILRRYLDEDKGYHAVHGWDIKVPRFLLNDIARYWRTMTVDYAAKRREREWSGWAIRNFKLRMSRKLIFVAGFAMCLNCELRPPHGVRKQEQSENDFYAALSDYLLGFTNRTPLEILADFGMAFDPTGTTVAELFEHYDAFLAILRDHDQRARLESMDLEEALTDPVFTRAREVGTNFQEGLNKLFFSTDGELTRKAQRYGVF